MYILYVLDGIFGKAYVSNAKIIIKFTFISIYSTYVHNKGKNIEHMYVHLLLPIRKLLSHNITNSYCAWAIIVLIWQTYKICCHGYIKLYSVQRYPQFTSCLIFRWFKIPQGSNDVQKKKKKVWTFSSIFLSFYAL